MILLGHSLGGILAADVALLQRDGQTKHRILGLVNFDVPFLGLHPRVIPTGIWSSVAQKQAAPEDQLADEQESLGMAPAYGPVTPHPNFDPPFRNDVRLAQRGFFKGVMHFINKNASNLDTLANSLVDRLMSPMKHAGCVNNYAELRERHQRLIALENAESSPERVRFINYYTASTGRIKPTKPPKPEKHTKSKKKQVQDSPDGIEEKSAKETSPEEMDLSQPLPEIFIDESHHAEERECPHPPPPTRNPPEIPVISQSRKIDSSLSNTSTTEAQSLRSRSSDSLFLSPTVSSETSRPSIATDTISSPSCETLSPASAGLSQNTSVSSSQPSPDLEMSPHKLRKFILLPSHHWKWNDNAHWTPVLMHDMTEVTAHQSLFFPRGSNYDYLVGDTVALVEQWIHTDLSRRLMHETLD